MKGSFPTEAQGIILSNAFMEMDPRRSQLSEELVSNGPPGCPEHILTLVQNQRPELPRRPRASHTPSLTLPDHAIQWNLEVDWAPQISQGLGSSYIEECLHSISESVQEKEIILHMCNSTCGIPYQQNMNSSNVYKVRKCSYNPSIHDLPFWVNQWPLPCRHTDLTLKWHVPSTLGICKVIKYYLEEEVPKES